MLFLPATAIITEKQGEKNFKNKNKTPVLI